MLTILSHGLSSGGLAWNKGQQYGRWEVRARTQQAVGYGVATVFLSFGAPDLAMTQFSVETLTVLIYVLVVGWFRSPTGCRPRCAGGSSTAASPSPTRRIGVTAIRSPR